MRFQLTPRSMIFDELELSPNFCRISRDFADFGGNNSEMNENRPYCHRQRCNPLNVLVNIVFLALICRRFLHYGPS